MDFVADVLFDGRRLWALAVVDNYTRECPRAPKKKRPALAGHLL